MLLFLNVFSIFCGLKSRSLYLVSDCFRCTNWLLLGVSVQIGISTYQESWEALFLCAIYQLSLLSFRLEWPIERDSTIRKLLSTDQDLADFWQVIFLVLAVFSIVCLALPFPSIWLSIPALFGTKLIWAQQSLRPSLSLMTSALALFPLAIHLFSDAVIGLVFIEAIFISLMLHRT